MSQQQCTNCRIPLDRNDVFCGNCGTPVIRPAASGQRAAGGAGADPGHPAADIADAVPWTQTTRSESIWRDTGATPGPDLGADQGRGTSDGTHRKPRGRASSAAADPFFRHAAQRARGPISNSTRYLCAAAYLDPTFPNLVLGELVASRRAVVPSVGIDLEPIIRHCLQARKSQLIRDALLAVLLLAGLYFSALPTIGIMAFALLLGMLPRVQWERKSVGVKLLTGASAVVVIGALAAAWIMVSLLGQVSRSIPQLGPLATGYVTIVAGLIVLALFSITLVSYSYAKYRTLTERLRPGADPYRTGRAEDWIESRIAEITAAQSGNVTLYSGENPFIGTGARDRVWSIAIELNRAHSTGNGWGTPESRAYAPIDPVELQETIRKRLLRLKDPGLPENERVAGLVVDDHVVGEGQRRWDSPLIDPGARTPYSEASQEAIDALIRHPQAGLRYYQRVSVSDEGQAVRARRRVLGPADQELAVSSFIYTAVEGRMFYLEFVATVLPPIQRGYHVIDMLPKVTSGAFTVKVLLDAASTAFADILTSPFDVCSTLLRMRRERRSFRQEISSADDYLHGDLGARISVRELGAAARPHTYIQRLDTKKYTKIIETLVNDTVLDFLVAKGADATAYRNYAQTVINSGVMISGSTLTNSAVAAGAAPVVQTVRQTAGRAPG